MNKKNYCLTTPPPQKNSTNSKAKGLQISKGIKKYIELRKITI